MKIETGGVSNDQIQTNWNGSRPDALGASNAQNASSDRTTVSSDSATVQSLVSQAASLPDVRYDKVQALRQAVSSGTYQVDSQKLATAMMSDT